MPLTSIAITDEHRALGASVSDFLDGKDSRGASRELLENPSQELPPFWKDACDLGWPGLHLPEEFGGSGYGLPELLVVVEEFGYGLAPGPFTFTSLASAILASAGSDELKDRLLRDLAAGTLVGTVALDGSAEWRDGSLNGDGGAAPCLGIADVILVRVGDDIAVVDRGAQGVDVEIPENLDPTRPSGRVRFDGTAAELLSGPAGVAVDLARAILSAEATGVARFCTDSASQYAIERQQFGRPIATFQAVKHHCANMAVATELATAATWDASRAAAAGGAQFSYAAAMAAALAGPAGEKCAQLNIQVHGGIGFTWEHDAHLYLRRATAIASLLDVESASQAITDLARAGVQLDREVDLPPEAEAMREEVRSFVVQIKDLEPEAQRSRLVESGYGVAHWPKPWGREAGAVEQLVIEQEFAAASVARPAYGITGWVILTLIQHGDPDQIQRWVPPALAQDVIWCQLFSEPDAGSDAAGIKTRGTRVEGGWLVNGQKVWTSGAHLAKWGLATIRTDPDAPKHNGITMMVIDMEAEGVEVRPLKMPMGASEFNEVFFNDVLVPDDDVVGPVDGGWTVARATLGNESVSIGGGQGAMVYPGEMFIPLHDSHPERLSGGAGRIGRYIAAEQVMKALNLRSAHRAVAGGAPGPEGNMTKLVSSENLQEAAMIASELMGPDTLFMDERGATAGSLVLMHRAMSIAGGTSEIKRNQIGERILGLPRDPLIN